MNVEYVIRNVVRKMNRKVQDDVKRYSLNVVSNVVRILPLSNKRATDVRRWMLNIVRNVVQML